jgi:hypothetical protein
MTIWPSIIPPRNKRPKMFISKGVSSATLFSLDSRRLNSGPCYSKIGPYL